ncbi:uncharacterized protein PRCAT00003840001 [Priceomyces carsonii]|uniref:uncharacterized protein n=1 Tax=Priceomyces carsonii TaxID=28549 RepID=UPI002EDB715B|nr:unnamed protein product [Priceomyces carsonii]
MELESMASDRDPLLGSQESIQSFRGEPQVDELDDVQSKYTDDDADSIFIRGHRFSKKRFWWSCFLGIIAIIILHLSFLPRTSFSRDFRRWHGLHLTKSDVKRSFLVFSGIGAHDNYGSNEDHINWWLTNITDFNSKSPVNLLADDNLPLVSYVKKSFKSMGFEPEEFTYDAPDLKKPISLSLKLLDSEEGTILYASDLLEPKFSTPAFSSLGYNGTAKGAFVFINEGTNGDYELLKSNGINPKDKIVISKSDGKDSGLTLAEKLIIAKRQGAKALVNYYDLKGKDNQGSKSNLEHAIIRESAGYGQLNDLTLTDILCIPVNLKTIKVILDTLSINPRDDAFKDWDYYPEGDGTLILDLSCLFEQKPKSRRLSNIVGSIHGVLKDGDVVIGARRDSFTSSNPLSGHAVMLEIMRHMKKLRKIGWKPLRTIKFVSWDASSSGLIGSQKFTNDISSFNPNHPILCYINIDGDAVTGSKFKVDSNPSFNHLLKDISKYIVLPKKSNPYEDIPGTLPGDIDDDNLMTLYRYWSNQDNRSINNILGEQIADKDALVFQTHLGVPIVNVKFENNPSKDTSLYIPGSNYYSYNWLMKRDIDNKLGYHSTLVRFLGLLMITFSEHEVAHIKTESYFKTILDLFKESIDSNSDKLKAWSDRDVPTELISKFYLYSDLKEELGDGSVFTFGDVLNRLQGLLNETIILSVIYDNYAVEVEESLIQDFAWYKYYKKLKIYAQFKVSNYKLLHFEKGFQLATKDYDYLNLDPKKTFFNHIIFGVAKFSPKLATGNKIERFKQSAFAPFQDSIRENDFAMATKWLVVIYEKLRNLNKRLA